MRGMRWCGRRGSRAEFNREIHEIREKRLMKKGFVLVVFLGALTWLALLAHRVDKMQAKVGELQDQVWLMKQAQLTAELEAAKNWNATMKALIGLQDSVLEAK